MSNNGAWVQIYGRRVVRATSLARGWGLEFTGKLRSSKPPIRTVV